MTEAAVMNTQIQLSADEAIAIAAAMKDVATTDGVHPAEEELIAEFIANVGEDLGETFELPEMSPTILCEKLATADVRLLAVQSLVLVAMADGNLSDGEAAVNAKYAAALGLGDQYSEIENAVKGWVEGGDIAPLFD